MVQPQSPPGRTEKKNKNKKGGSGSGSRCIFTSLSGFSLNLFPGCFFCEKERIFCKLKAGLRKVHNSFFVYVIQDERWRGAGCGEWRRGQQKQRE